MLENRIFLASLCFIVLLALTTGCAVRERTAAGGIAGVFEPRADTGTITTMRYVGVVHCENRAEETATRDAIQWLDNTTGWTKVVGAVSTQGERIAEDAIGGDRAEALVLFELDEPHRVEGSIADIVEKLNGSLEKMHANQESCYVESIRPGGDSSSSSG